jgi:uncharacterized repeat protein (TIGR01451 family)
VKILRRIFLALVLFVFNIQSAWAAIDFVFTSGDSATGVQSLANDSNNCPTDGPFAAYVSGTVTNSGAATVTGISADISGLGSGFTLTGTQSTTLSVGSLAAGASALIGWHITYPCDTSKKTDPGPSVSPVVTLTSDTEPTTITNLTLLSRKAISANAGGNITSTTLGPGAIVGQTLFADVLFDFGGNSAGDEFFTQPAGNTDFDAACLRLVGAEVTSSNVTAAPVGTKDELYFVSPASQSGNGYFIGIRFSYKYLCANTTSTARPYAVQTSGNTNIKYTGNYDSGVGVTFDFPTSTNPFTISKSATPSSFIAGSGPYTATYTVTLTNPSTFDALVDGFTDTLPTNVSFQGFTAASDVDTLNSGAYPTVGDTGVLTFAGLNGSSYAITAGGTLDIVYQTEIPDTIGTYLNTATANIGPTILGSDNFSVTVIGGAEFTATKEVSVYDPLSSGLYAIPGNEMVYTFTVTNIGGSEADAETVVIEDQLPANVTFYNGDFDPANVGMGPFDVNLGASGVTCCALVGEAEFSSSASAPPVYGYSPSANYDPNTKYIRITPSGAFQGGAVMTVSFRVKIK